MCELTKRDGTREKYDSAKFDESLWRAGASASTIMALADMLAPSDGESTQSYRTRITASLREVNRELAVRYDSAHRIRTFTNADVPEGRVVLNFDTARSYGLEIDGIVWLQGNSRNAVASALLSSKLPSRVARLNPKDMEHLGIIEGAKVLLGGLSTSAPRPVRARVPALFREFYLQTVQSAPAHAYRMP
jgi:hypothetical protein